MKVSSARFRRLPCQRRMPQRRRNFRRRLGTRWFLPGPIARQPRRAPNRSPHLRARDGDGNVLRPKILRSRPIARACRAPNDEGMIRLERLKLPLRSVPSAASSLPFGIRRSMFSLNPASRILGTAFNSAMPRPKVGSIGSHQVTGDLGNHVGAALRRFART